MTLQDFFDACTSQPSIPLFYFIAVPLSAFLAYIFSRGEGHLSPWKYLYTILIYLAVIPGLFSITLNVYLFLFERQSIYQADLIIQVIPILSMFLTIWLIRHNVLFEQIPGFGHLSGLVIMILILLSILWILDKTRIFLVSFLPFPVFILLFTGLVVLFRVGWRKLFE